MCAISWQRRNESVSSMSSSPVRIWLCFIALLLGAIVLVGGATRLTESGLSITEWKPVTGAVPPLSGEAWNSEFEKYQLIPQYQLINKGMSLSQFKFIYFWEWSHRLLGRLIGVAFLLPLLFFWWQDMLDKKIRTPLAFLFILGGLQGFIGWWMVASGLTARTSVAPYRLAAHLTLAFLIFAGIVWLIVALRKPRAFSVPAPLTITWRMGWFVLAVAFAQVFMGAVVAGLDAGLTFITWPLMDGNVVPPSANLFVQIPWWRNIFENPLTAQFIHRCLAYALLAGVLLYAILTRKDHREIRFTIVLMCCTVFLQAVLGVLTLIHAVPLPLALLHQLGALVIIGVMSWHLSTVSQMRAPFRLRNAKSPR
jgi:cytochrome c oxidase assembly protein subunit 15